MFKKYYKLHLLKYLTYFIIFFRIFKYFFRHCVQSVILILKHQYIFPFSQLTGNLNLSLPKPETMMLPLSHMCNHELLIRNNISMGFIVIKLLFKDQNGN
jgi:hypothetical protein